jgi:signal transduction histidine kinase
VKLRTSRLSLRVRVTLATTALLALALIVGAFVLTAWLRGALMADTDGMLDDQIRSVIQLAGDGQLPRVLDSVGEETGQIQAITADRVVIAASPGVAESARFDVVAAPALGKRMSTIVDGSAIDGHPGERYRVISRTVSSRAGIITVYGVSTLRSADRAVRTLSFSLLAGIPFLVALTAVLTWRAVGGALAPVDRMRADADAIESAPMGRRLTAPAGGDELARLAATLNHMLERVDDSVRSQRRFAADASHELRSPLASARAQLEVGLAYPAHVDWPQTAGDVLVEIDRLERLSRELLALATVDAIQRLDVNEDVDLAALVAGEVATIADSRCSVYADLGDTDVSGDPDLLVRVVRNLLQNAIRHVETRIDVRVHALGGVVKVQVVNDGAPIAAEQRERIFDRFTRLDDARAADEGGSGLGLPIARRIARLHGGDLIADPVTHGASFTLTLPAAPASAERSVGESPAPQPAHP